MRDRRQLVVTKTPTMEGDIIIRQPSTENSSTLDAVLADPSRLWPMGVIEFQFYSTFPAENRRKVLEAMEYITREVPCITFQPKSDTAHDFVTIYDGASCSSELGRVGGNQALLLNR